MAGKKVEVLEGEIGQLKTDLERRFSDFQNQISTNNERMEGKFAIMEEMLKKLLEVKTAPATSEARGTNDDHGRRGNPNMFRERENTDVEVLEGEDGMPPLEPLSREEISIGFERRTAEFTGRREDVFHQGADFERGRGESDEGGRVVQEGKERRRQWAQRKIQFKSDKESVPEAKVEAPAIRGMLPSNIVNLLAAREKQTFTSDSEEEVVNHKPANLKKKKKSSGPEIVLLEEIPPAQWLENSLEFLKRRKMKVSRSNSVLINAKQALRLLSTPGNLLSKG
ncbi:hypothetical protein M5K25_016011 [Dendrobium thyrsiflorum]|uniref:Uncharacterized protein n=1 Tax=Dendrobium thyrsiflorum TaxID=117978 RepID=A0ABD0UZV5_DENTH